MDETKPKGSPLLTLENLTARLHTPQGSGNVVDGISFSIHKGETLGLVGESGCGKSMTSLSILRLVPEPTVKIISGRILFQGVDLLTLPEADMRRIRGNRIAMIFQEPMTALNPVFTVGEQIAEVFRLHKRMNRREAWDAAVEMMERVKIPAAAQRALEYPHQMSGGMRQRIVIAMALACDPDLLIADEPTTALDVTVQAQILALMKELQERQGTAILLITHDLGVIAETADRVAVMYAGQIAEEAPVHDLFTNPMHPYTRGLLHAIPRFTDDRNERLHVIPGNVPMPAKFPSGCRFHPRCSERFEPCDMQPCDMLSHSNEHAVRCFMYSVGVLSK